MRILKQPSGLDFQQPILNQLLRVHCALMYSTRSGKSVTYYDAKTREVLPYYNWRVKMIKRFGT